MSYNNISCRQQISLAPKSEIPTLFFPHWVECPYRFHVRLVWAALMDLARRKQTLSARKIEDLTGLSDNTIRLAVHTLVKDNLCTIHKGKRRTTRIDLIEPADDAKYWASKDGEGWLNHIAYTMIGFPPGLPVIQAVLLGKVAALKGKQSYRGLAEMLGLTKRAVNKSLDALVALVAIRVGSLPDGYFTIDVAEMHPSSQDQEPLVNNAATASKDEDVAEMHATSHAKTLLVNNPASVSTDGDVAEMHPSIKANSPFVNNPSSASESRGVAEMALDGPSLTTEMSQKCTQDVAEMHGDVADVARDVAEMHPSIMGTSVVIQK